VCAKMLRDMIDEAMRSLRGVAEYDVHLSVTTAVPLADYPARWRAACASLTFLDDDLLAAYLNAGALVAA
jgi:hypothetical protein